MQMSSSMCADLDTACQVLARSRRVQSLVKEAVGIENFSTAHKQMKLGKLEGPVGDIVHDLLLDTIQNDATPVWTGFIRQPHDDYPVHVNEYRGVFWVWAMEYDPIGYFLEKDSAIDFARSNWDNVHESGENTESDKDEQEETRCPYCRTTESCGHLLLMVDTTFRHAEGGLLYDAFNTKWALTIEEANDADFDEREPFDDLLEHVDSLADTMVEASPDSAPGMSSNISYYFCSSKKKTIKALKEFSKE
jgi:hypothetical protein